MAILYIYVADILNKDVDVLKEQTVACSLKIHTFDFYLLAVRSTNSVTNLPLVLLGDFGKSFRLSLF